MLSDDVPQFAIALRVLNEAMPVSCLQNSSSPPKGRSIGALFLR